MTILRNVIGGMRRLVKNIPEQLDYFGDLPLLQRQCCSDVVEYDPWDGLPPSCLLEGAWCPLLGPNHAAPDPPAIVDPEPGIPLFIKSLALAALIFFCLGIAIWFFCATVRRLWSTYVSLEFSIDFEFETNTSLYPDSAAAAIPAAGVGRPELEVLTEGLLARGLVLKNTASDGNCLFRSIAHHALGDEDWYAHIRANAVHELRADPFAYMPFVTGDYDRYQSYVDVMAQDGQWGSEVEAKALTRGLGRPVRIWRTNPETGAVVNFFHKVESDNAADSSSNNIDIDNDNNNNNNNNVNDNDDSNNINDNNNNNDDNNDNDNNNDSDDNDDNDDNTIDIAFYDKKSHYFAVLPLTGYDAHRNVQEEEEVGEGEEGGEEGGGAPAEDRSAAEAGGGERGKEAELTRAATAVAIFG